MTSPPSASDGLSLTPVSRAAPSAEPAVQCGADVRHSIRNHVMRRPPGWQVNARGAVLIDKLVRVDEAVTDYRTAITGITAADLADGMRRQDSGVLEEHTNLESISASACFDPHQYFNNDDIATALP